FLGEAGTRPRDWWEWNRFLHHTFVGAPEWFRGWYELDWNFWNEGPEPIGAILHTCLFRNHVAKQDQGFPVAFRYRVLDILDQFALACLSGDKDIHAFSPEFRDARHAAYISPACQCPVDREFRVAHHAHSSNLQARLNFFR